MDEKNIEKEELNNIENTNEVDEDLEFLKAQIRHKKMIKEKRQKKELEENYDYIKRFKVNSVIELIAGIIAIILGILTKKTLMTCLGITVICFAYLFYNIAKRGEKKREGNSEKENEKIKN